MRSVVAFISDLLYNLNITKRPCLVGWRIYIKSVATRKDIVYTYPFFFTSSKPSLCVTGKSFRGEEPIMQDFTKSMETAVNFAYMRIYGEHRNKEQV